MSINILLLPAVLAVVAALIWGVAALLKRRRRSRFAIYGCHVNTFSLPRDGEVQYAQWLHPKEMPKSISQEQIDALRKFIRPGSTVIDVGAHTGDTSVAFAVAAGRDGCVLAFEPNPYVFKALAKNAELNRDRAQIVPFCFAATQDDGTFTFHYSDGAYCNGGFLDQIHYRRHGHRQPLNVEGKNLERYLRQHHADRLRNLALIKVDTEGYDRQVIESISGIIREFRPTLVCEVYRRLDRSEREALYDLLGRLGYDCFEYTVDTASVGSAISRGDLMTSPHFDVIAMPRQVRQAAA